MDEVVHCHADTGMLLSLTIQLKTHIGIPALFFIKVQPDTSFSQRNENVPVRTATPGLEAVEVFQNDIKVENTQH